MNAANASATTLSNSSSNIVIGTPAKTFGKLRASLRPDPLTLLPTRQCVLGELSLVASRSRNTADDFAVLCVDIDHFHLINATYGYPIGDETIQIVADILRTQLEHDDLVARNAGDSFIVVMKGIRDRCHAEARAQSIFRAIGTTIMVGRASIPISLSLGVALYSEAEDDHGLLRNAELALATVKRRGGNGCAFHSKNDPEQSPVSLKIRSDLYHAIRRNEIEVFYQPIFSAEKLIVTAAEALLRWRHPTMGLISPTVFIPIAEQTGLITELGEFVLRKACFDAANWQKKVSTPISLEVNLSHYQTIRGVDKLTADIKNVLEESTFPAALLKLELTESCFVDNPAAMKTWFDHLKDAGIRLAIDDFGTGYSSLTNLRMFPVEVVKIDRSFVAESHVSEGRAMLRNIIVMAHDLDMAVIAEGVETDDQLSLLRSLRCDYIQGFLLEKPLSSSEFTAFLSAYGGSARQRNAAQ